MEEYGGELPGEEEMDGVEGAAAEGAAAEEAAPGADDVRLKTPPPSL